ncbi:MAG: hypothetical protein QM817_10470 [Archangium sp.]
MRSISERGTFGWPSPSIFTVMITLRAINARSLVIPIPSSCAACGCVSSVGNGVAPFARTSFISSRNRLSILSKPESDMVPPSTDEIDLEAASSLRD